MRKVFICGCGHTGTTLLATILSVHSKIYCSFVETWSYVDADKKYILESLLKESELRKEEVFLEKTPKHVYHVDEIRKDHSPHFIFMVRNGYDCISSLEKRYQNFEKAYDRYINDHLEVMKHAGCVVRYEDLISDTESTLKKVCNYIDLEYEPQLLNYHKIEHPVWKDPDNDPNIWHRSQQVKRPIYKTVHEIDKEKCQSVEFNKIMEYFDYDN